MMERALRIIRPTFRALRLHQRGLSEASSCCGDSHLSQVRQMSSSSTAEGSREKKDDGSSNVISQLKSAQKFEDILAFAHTNELNGNQASIALSALRNSNLFSNAEKSDLSSDERFVSLLGTIETDLTKLTSESLVNSIINIFKLQQVETPTVRLLEKECRQRLRGVAVRHLALLVCNTRLLSGHPGSALLAQEALRVLELRWKEMNNPFVLKRLLKTSLHLSSSFLEKLEDKTLELIDDFSFQDLVDISSYFVSSARRSLLVLRSVSYQVEEQRSQWEVFQLLRLLNNMRISKFQNYVLCKEVASFCKEHLRECSSRQVAAIVKCFGLLHMPEMELFDAIFEHLSSHMTEFKVSQLQTIAFGMSVLNLKPPTQLVKRLVFEFDSLSFFEQMEVCLALAVFNACPAEQMRKLLATKRVDEIMGSSEPRHIPLQLKLLQLNTYATLECPGYEGPFLSEDHAQYPKIETTTKSNLHRDVVGRLEAALGNDKYFLSHVEHDSGYVIDAMIAVDKDGVPFSKLDYNISSASRDHSPLCKDLPESAVRVAVVVNGPNSYLYGSSELMGRRQLMVRQLQSLKYRVVQISFEEWSNLKTETKKVEYLKEKLDGFITLK